MNQIAYIVTKIYRASIYDKHPDISPGMRIMPAPQDGKFSVYRGEDFFCLIDSSTFQQIQKKLDAPDLMSDIGKQIRAARIARGMTQEELGSKIRASRNYINKVEAGKSFISLEQLQKLVIAMEYDLTVKITRNYAKQPKQVQETAQVHDSPEPGTPASSDSVDSPAPVHLGGGVEI